MFRLVKKHGVGAEIGVYRAHFSQVVMKIAVPSVYYLVDAWKTQPGMLPTMTNEWHRTNLYKTLTNMEPFIASGVVRPLCGMSKHVAPQIADNSLDWVYIDADHSYSGCLLDLNLWWPKVRSGGFVMGHDYHELREPGVIRAVAEFGAKHGLDKPHVTKEHIPSYWWEKR